LEVLDKTMTAITFRNEFRKIDVNFDKRMALVEFLLFEYKQEVATLMARPQDENKEEIEKAQAKMAEVQKALEEVLAELEEQKKAVAAQKQLRKPPGRHWMRKQWLKTKPRLLWRLRKRRRVMHTPLLR